MMMRSVALCLLIAAALILPGNTSSTAAVSPNASAQRLSIVVENHRILKVSFPTEQGTDYQVYVSNDLVQWRFLGVPVHGTGDTVAVTYELTGENAFFRVAAKPQPQPITLSTRRGEGQSLNVSFATASGKKYQVSVSSDLQNWQAFGDLIESSGQTISFVYNPDAAGASFFRVEEIDVTPLTNMVWIKAGAFTMGSPLTELDRDLDEDPLTQVILRHGFWIGKYEVTQAEYEKLIGINPSQFRGTNLPVEMVNWKEAIAYCTRLTAQEQTAGRLPAGYEYRLPTEAEFEYVARAGTSTRYSFGNDLDYGVVGQYVWYDENSGERTHPVGQKLPNPFGVYDINGNVWEWCLDWYFDFYPGGSVTDPKGPASGVTRVFRGGGWDWNAPSCRSAFRNTVEPGRRTAYIGFRIVLAPSL